MISSALTNAENREELLCAVKLSSLSESTLVRFDPAVSRAINFSLEEKLIFRQGNGLFRLNDKGKELVKSIYADSSLMNTEKVFFSSLSDKLTEDIIDEFSLNWRDGNAENK